MGDITHYTHHSKLLALLLSVGNLVGVGLTVMCCLGIILMKKMLIRQINFK